VWKDQTVFGKTRNLDLICLHIIILLCKIYKFFYLSHSCERLGEITVLTKATTKSKSLRTTIPIGIVKQFNLSKGDKLNWEFKAEGNEIVIIVKPIKVNKNEER